MAEALRFFAQIRITSKSISDFALCFLRIKKTHRIRPHIKSGLLKQNFDVRCVAHMIYMAICKIQGIKPTGRHLSSDASGNLSRCHIKFGTIQLISGVPSPREDECRYVGKENVISIDAATWYHVTWQIEETGETRENVRQRLYLDGVLISEQQCYLDPVTWSVNYKLQLGNVVTSDVDVSTYPAAPASPEGYPVHVDEFQVIRGIESPTVLMTGGGGAEYGVPRCVSHRACVDACQVGGWRFTGVFGVSTCQCARSKGGEAGLCEKLGVATPTCSGESFLAFAFAAVRDHILVGAVTDTGPWHNGTKCGQSCTRSAACGCFGAWTSGDLSLTSPEPRCYQAEHPCELAPLDFRARLEQPSSPDADERDSVHVVKAASCVECPTGSAVDPAGGTCTCAGGMFPTFEDLPCVNEGALVFAEAILSLTGSSPVQQRMACVALAKADGAAYLYYIDATSSFFFISTPRHHFCQL
jgi:hypothetical protein